MHVETGKLPRIAMFAANNIAKGEELFWDYFSSYNPTKCLLNTGDTSAKGMKWIYSRRTKLREIKYQIPKRKSSERNGVCVICYKHPKKLSNHLINTHKINSNEKRLQLIKEGISIKEKRDTGTSQSKSFSKNWRRSLTCKLCNRDNSFG